MSDQSITVAGEVIKPASREFREHDPQVTARLLDILLRGSQAWNSWRAEHPTDYIDLRGVSLLGRAVSLDGVDLSEANLHSVHLGGISLQNANLTAANLYGATLQSAKLQGARLAGAHLSEADLSIANLTGADLRGADLSWAGMMLVTADRADLRKANLQAAYIFDASFAWANLEEANLTDAILRGSEFVEADLSLASLEGTSLVETNLTNAKLNGCRVYGASVWKPNLKGAEQRNLVITASGEPEVTVDNLKVAQFVYLLLENAEVREVIDTITSKMVLILGRFTAERKRILDEVKAVLREHGFLPVIFDFHAPARRDLKETVSTLAHLARFIIADISEPRSIPQELAAIVPTLPSVPVIPVIQRGETPWAMFESIARYPWVLELREYDSLDQIKKAAASELITPAEEYLARSFSK